nr:alpha-ketoglutaric semialdehyde dehydrogenase 2-like [Nerophis lumbriciformis]
MELHGKHLLGGTTSAAGELTLTAIDPATGEELAPSFAEATSAEIDRAAELAGGVAPAYAALEPERRADFLDQIGEQILGLGNTLLKRAAAETALPAGRLTGERGRTVGQLRQFAALIREGSWVEAIIDQALPQRQPLPRPDLRRMLIPLGPVAVFGASNFPLAFSVAGGDTASVLAAGCPVVVKAHPAHPGTSELVGRAIVEAARTTGMPNGVFSMVHGAGHEVGAALVEHPQIQAVGFTGSLRGGRALFDLAASRSRPIPVYAEMGSANPVFVLPGAVAERGAAIAEGLAGSVTLGAGQFCTNPGLTVVLGDSAADQLVNRAAELLGEAGPLTVVHPSIRQGFEDALAEVTAIDGVEVVSRSEKAASHSQTDARATLLRTDGSCFLAHPRLGEEVYGPATLAVRCTDREQLLRVAEGLDGHLTATIHGTDQDLQRYGDLLTILRRKAGRLIWNGYPTGVEVAPAMQHGGPYPATTDPRSTSVGTAAIQRFARPVCYQDFPQLALPAELRDDNPSGIWRQIDGQPSQKGSS